jgi:nickel-dependent lactate racemase
VKVELAYGECGLLVDLPADRTTVVQPRPLDAVADERGAVLDALRRPTAGPPLLKRVQPGQRVAISICDGTRPQPRHIVVPAVLDELEGVIDAGDIVVLVATGTHRGNTAAELEAMLGHDVLDRVQVVNHDARDDTSLRWVGQMAGDVPVWLNSRWVEADVRVTTGFVEPHFFAGFSGGPKMVAPGLAGLDTVLALHNAVRISDERATWGVTVGNPVHDAVREIAASTGVDFAVDVLLNRHQRIVEVFAGDLLDEHSAACAAARRVAMAPVPSAFDVVVTTNAGFPLDQNLYQCVKGMAAGSSVVRPGGLLVCVAECRDGFPDHGSYREVLSSEPSPDALLQAINARPATVPDQWQVQVQASVQSRARVVVHTSGLTATELAEAHLGHTADVGATVRDELARLGTGATLCALPEGPLTIPYVEAT